MEQADTVPARLVHQVHKHLEVTGPVEWQDDGFTHWKNGLAQRIRFDGPYDMYGIDIAHLSFESGFLRTDADPSATFGPIIAKLNEAPGLFVPEIIGDRLKLRGRQYLVTAKDPNLPLLLATFALWTHHVATLLAFSPPEEWRAVLAGTSADTTVNPVDSTDEGASLEQPAQRMPDLELPDPPAPAAAAALDLAVEFLNSRGYSEVEARTPTSVKAVDPDSSVEHRVSASVELGQTHPLVGKGTRFTTQILPQHGEASLHDHTGPLNQIAWNTRRGTSGLGTWVPVPHGGIARVTFLPGQLPSEQVFTLLVRQLEANRRLAGWSRGVGKGGARVHPRLATMPAPTSSIAATQQKDPPTPKHYPLADVIRIWDRVEPGRFPLAFGGFAWRRDAPEEHRSDLTHEFAAAIDAAAQRGWTFDLEVPHVGQASASVTFAAGARAAAKDEDPLAAFIRATVDALSMAAPNQRATRGLFKVVSFSGMPAVAGHRPLENTPTQDLRVWKRIERHRFHEPERFYSSPLYKGSHGNVLAPAHRAMVVLQYVTAASVFESAALRGWRVRLLGVVDAAGRAGYECEVILSDGRIAHAAYVSPGPASVKAYLQALVLVSEAPLSLTPHPVDRFGWPVVLVETSGVCRLPDRRRRDSSYVEVTGRFVAYADDVRRDALDLPEDLVVLDRKPSAEEIEASQALGIL